MSDLPPPLWAQTALNQFAAQDPHLGRIEAIAGPLPWRVRQPGFCGLLNAIVGQQISNMAAAAIWRRVCDLPGWDQPATFLALDETTLRAAGLSRAKVVYSRAVAEAFENATLATDALCAMEDDAAIAAISSVRGLGAWSAEIYLLFALERPDVFPAGDLALAAAAADLFGLAGRPTPSVLRQIATPWAPFRSVAARLLWHWWRHLTGRPSTDELAAAN